MYYSRGRLRLIWINDAAPDCLYKMRAMIPQYSPQIHGSLHPDRQAHREKSYQEKQPANISGDTPAAVT